MITSTANAQVKELIRLMKKSRAREDAGVFIVEGPRMAGELTDDPAWQERIERVYLSESYAAKHKGEQDGLRRTSRVEILADNVFDHVSDTKTPQGILAVVKRKEYDLEDILGGQQGNSLVIVLDNLQDPGNLGTIFRTAEAAGATGILLSRDCVDIYNPKVIRSTMGAVFRLPVWNCSLEELRERLAAAGLPLVGAALRQDTVDLHGADLRRGAVLIGSEGRGLSREALAACDATVRIPMEARCESLNAAAAAAVLRWEGYRQT